MRFFHSPAANLLDEANIKLVHRKLLSSTADQRTVSEVGETTITSNRMRDNWPEVSPGKVQVGY